MRKSFLVLALSTVLTLLSCSKDVKDEEESFKITSSSLDAYVNSFTDSTYNLTIGTISDLYNQNDINPIDNPDISAMDLPSGDVNPGEQNPGEVNPGDVNPGEGNPGQQNPGEQNPGEVNPGQQNPGEVNPGEQNPGEQNQGEINSGDNNVPQMGSYYFLSSGITATLMINNDVQLYSFADQNSLVDLASIVEGSYLRINFTDEKIDKIYVFDASQVMTMDYSQMLDKKEDFNKIIEDSSTYAASATYSLDASVNDEIFESTNKDENGVLVQNGNVYFTNCTISRDESLSLGGEDSLNKGVGASFLATGGNSYISDSTIVSNSCGASGIYALSSATIYAINDTITTLGNDAPGLVSNEANLYGYDLKITTSGANSPSILNKGNMVIDGGTYTVSGANVANINNYSSLVLNNVNMTSNYVNAILESGTLRLYNSSFTSTSSSFLFNSGNNTLTISDSSLTANGDVLFTLENGNNNILLDNVTININEASLLNIKGGTTLLQASNQNLVGDITLASSSTLDFYLKDNVNYNGNIINNGEANIYISSNSKWIVSDNCSITNLYNQGTIVDKDDKLVTIKDLKGNILVNGTSDLVITVDSYSTNVDFTKLKEIEDYNIYKVTKPIS